jgi:hypothetical protein
MGQPMIFFALIGFFVVPSLFALGSATNLSVGSDICTPCRILECPGSSGTIFYPASFSVRRFLDKYPELSTELKCIFLERYRKTLSEILTDFFQNCLQPNSYEHIHTNLLVHLDKVKESLNIILTDPVIFEVEKDFRNVLMPVLWELLLPSLQLDDKPIVKSTSLLSSDYIEVLELYVKREDPQFLKDRYGHFEPPSHLLQQHEDVLKYIGKFLSCWSIIILRHTCKQLRAVFTGYKGIPSRHPLVTEQLIRSILPQ